mmetsp:Transcript_4746/g.30016  ORF Transcript_4746/g.30016 Transcript_4746/m.30016 type:complete len:201 (+) Transcript_4746:34-636(+)
MPNTWPRTVSRTQAVEEREGVADVDIASHVRRKRSKATHRLDRKRRRKQTEWWPKQSARPLRRRWRTCRDRKSRRRRQTEACGRHEVESWCDGRIDQETTRSSPRSPACVVRWRQREPPPMRGRSSRSHTSSFRDGHHPAGRHQNRKEIQHTYSQRERYSSRRFEASERARQRGRRSKDLRPWLCEHRPCPFYHQLHRWR